MDQDTRPLIVGAGPVGKAVALFLARAGMNTRLIDSNERPSQHSKALAVNPRTLEILEPTGVTEKLLAIGKRMQGGRFWRQDRLSMEISFQQLQHKYPFMLALSQAATERLLEEALVMAGGTVERGTSLVSCRNVSGGVEAELNRDSGAVAETVKVPWLLAADGAHSTTRHQMNIEFQGTSFEEPWHLADVPLETSLAEDWAHAFFFNTGGFLFLIRVIDEMANPPDGPLWRVISNHPDPIERLIFAKPSGAPVWTSSFHISHRINARLQVDNVYFAGDAAHIHSPIGARGMNLGIEDAWIFSQLVISQQMQRYGRLRHRVDQTVVKRIELISRMAQGQSVTLRFMLTLAPWLMKIPRVSDRILTTVAGLDHPLSLV